MVHTVWTLAKKAEAVFVNMKIFEKLKKKHKFKDNQIVSFWNYFFGVVSLTACKKGRSNFVCIINYGSKIWRNS